MCSCQLHPRAPPPYTFSFIYVLYAQDRSQPFLFACCFPFALFNYFCLASTVHMPKLGTDRGSSFGTFALFILCWMLEHIDTHYSCLQSHKCNPVFATPSLTITPSRPIFVHTVQSPEINDRTASRVQTRPAYGGRTLEQRSKPPQTNTKTSNMVYVTIAVQCSHFCPFCCYANVLFDCE